MTHFAFTLEPKQKPSTAILLIHGLFESPFVYRELANVLYTHGFFIRAMCLPGHGTQPEDLLKVSAEDWYQAVESEYQNLRAQFNKVVLIGHSTGAALALKLALRHSIQGLILLAPAIQIKTPLAKLLHSQTLADYVEQFFPWVERVEEKDMARYHSIPLNAVRQVFHLSQELKQDRQHPFSYPAFLISSQEDETISHREALTDFLTHPSHFLKRILIYTGAKHISMQHDQNSAPFNSNQNIQIEYRSSVCPALGILHQSHIGLLFSKSNAHYGIHGDYFRASRPNPKIQYGAFHRLHEIKSDSLHYLKFSKKIKRTLTFNPNFENMAFDILDFIHQSSFR